MKDPNQGRGPYCSLKGCGREKRADNHWFKIAHDAGALLLMDLSDPRPGDPVCGEECLSKKVAEWASAKREIFERLRAALYGGRNDGRRASVCR